MATRLGVELIVHVNQDGIRRGINPIDSVWLILSTIHSAIVHHLGLALGGRPAAGFAKRLMLPVGKDTLLRVVRRRSRPPSDPLRVIGIDDLAWRRNHRYASIVCNLERRRIVTLLPDREATIRPGKVSPFRFVRAKHPVARIYRAFVVKLSLDRVMAGDGSIQS
jgi:hypothetical protein